MFLLKKKKKESPSLLYIVSLSVSLSFVPYSFRVFVGKCALTKLLLSLFLSLFPFLSLSYKDAKLMMGPNMHGETNN